MVYTHDHLSAEGGEWLNMAQNSSAVPLCPNQVAVTQ